MSIVGRGMSITGRSMSIAGCSMRHRRLALAKATSAANYALSDTPHSDVDQLILSHHPNTTLAAALHLRH